MTTTACENLQQIALYLGLGFGSIIGGAVTVLSITIMDAVKWIRK